MNDPETSVKVNNCEREMSYLHENREYLEANHAGQWVALEGDKLDAIGDNSIEVKREAIAKGARNLSSRRYR